MPPQAKGWAAEWLAQPGSVAERKKKPLDVLAARLGPHGHGLGFGGFLYPVKPVRFPFNEKTVGPFHTPE